MLEKLEKKVGGKRVLGDPKPNLDLPKRGVYFFYSINDIRASSKQMRVTRIGTHAISKDSKSSLWNRLSTHRGTLKGSHPGGGNHRASVFRKIVGWSIIMRNNLSSDFPNWGIGNSAPSKIKVKEYELEKSVSNYIRKLPFLWIEIDDKPDKFSNRKVIERNSIALLSNFDKTAIDPRSNDWIGKYSPKVKIKISGLWNSDHVDEEYDPSFLDLLAKYIDDM